MRMSGPAGRLLKLLSERCGATPSVEQIRTRPWASATFSGARQALVLRFDGEAAPAIVDRLANGLEDAEFDLGRNLLVDIAVTDRTRLADGVRVTIEALTIEAD